MTTDLELLGRTIKQAQYRNHRAMDIALRDVGVTLVQWDALRAIERMPGASGHALAAATFQSDQAFGTLAQRMHARGLIVRSAGHGRRIDHSLTDAGHDALAAGRRIVATVLDTLFAPLDEPERALLARILTAVVGDETAP